MAASSNVTLSLRGVGADYVEILVTNQSASETGQVEIFYGTDKVAESEAVTVYQNTTPVTIKKLASGKEYTARFYSETYSGYSDSTVTFSTFPANRFYGSENSQANLVTDFYGSSNNQARRTTKLYGSVNGHAKLIHQGFGHLGYRTLASVFGAIPAWGGVGIRATAFDGGTLYNKITSDYPQFLPYSYCDAPIYRLKMVRKTTSSPTTADLILQFGDANAIVAEETLESDVRAIYVFDDYGITVSGEGGEVGAASYINLTPTYT